MASSETVVLTPKNGDDGAENCGRFQAYPIPPWARERFVQGAATPCYSIPFVESVEVRAFSAAVGRTRDGTVERKKPVSACNTRLIA